MAYPQQIGTDPNTGYPIFQGNTTVVQGHYNPDALTALMGKAPDAYGEDPNWSSIANSSINALTRGLSIPGRAIAALGRPDDESYLQSLNRTDNDDAKSFIGQAAQSILRSPVTPTMAVPGLAGGLFGAAISAANSYNQTGTVDPTSVASDIAMAAAPSALAKGLSFGNVNRLPGTNAGANFRDWFGAGTEHINGEPIEYYHGTYVPEGLKAIKPSAEGVYGPGIYVTGDPDIAESYGRIKSWIGRNRQDPLAGNQIVPLYTNVKSPFDFNQPVDFNRIAKAFPDYMPELRKMYRQYPDMPASNFYDAMHGLMTNPAMLDDNASFLKALESDHSSANALASIKDRLNYVGYDALKYPAPERIIEKGMGRYKPVANNMVIFNPESVKSPYNIGSWNPRDLDINRLDNSSPNIASGLGGLLARKSLNNYLDSQDNNQ